VFFALRAKSPAGAAAEVDVCHRLSARLRVGELPLGEPGGGATALCQAALCVHHGLADHALGLARRVDQRVESPPAAPQDGAAGANDRLGDHGHGSPDQGADRGSCGALGGALAGRLALADAANTALHRTGGARAEHAGAQLAHSASAGPYRGRCGHSGRRQCAGDVARECRPRPLEFGLPGGVAPAIARVPVGSARRAVLAGQQFLAQPRQA
jgi:hypothetical protein